MYLGCTAPGISPTRQPPKQSIRDLFGLRTFRLRDDCRTIDLGLDDDTAEHQWRRFTGMLVRPSR